MKNIWKIDLSARSAVILFVGVILNQLLFLAATLLKLPVWLDLTGTVYAAFLLGPTGGLLVGFVNNVLLAWGLYGASSTVYYVISAMIAIAVGIAAKKQMLNNILSICGMTFLMFLGTVFLAAALSLLLTDGIPGNAWGKMIYLGLRNQQCTPWLASLGAQTFMKLPDTIVTVILTAVAVLITPNPKEVKEDIPREKFTIDEH